MQIASDIDINTRLSGASLNLFYSSWTRLMREIVRRVTTSKKSDPTVKEFFRRCTERGVDEKFVRSLDLTKTRAVRSVGNGSKAGRLVALRELQGMYGRLDEVGRRNLDRDVISSSVGHEIANRYLPASVEPRTTVDNKIAFLENQQLNQGSPVPVLSTEMHGTHLRTHVPALAQLIEALNTGQADPMQAINTLQAFYQHISETLQFAAADPSLEADVSSANQVMQFAEEAINNTMKSIQKQQREAAQQEGDPQNEDQGLTPGQMKMQQAQIQMQIAQMKAEQEMELKQKKFDQEQAMRDAEAALKFREENPI